MKVARGLCWIASLAVVTVLFATQSAHAGALRFTLGEQQITIADQSASDLDSSLGTISFAGAIGDYHVNLTSAMTKPEIGSDQLPNMSLHSVNRSRGAGGRLVIEFTDTDFQIDDPDHFSGFFSDLFGSTTCKIQYETYFSNSNEAFAKDVLISDSGLLSPGAFKSSHDSSLAPNSTSHYSLTQVITLVHGQGSGKRSHFGADLNGTTTEPVTGTTPEPSSAALALIGLASAAVVGIRRRRKAQD